MAREALLTTSCIDNSVRSSTCIALRHCVSRVFSSAMCVKQKTNTQRRAPKGGRLIVDFIEEREVHLLIFVKVSHASYFFASVAGESACWASVGSMPTD